MIKKRTISVKKWLLLGVPFTLMLLLTASGYWLLRTHSGAMFLWAQLEDSTADAIRISDTQGDLSSGFVIRNLAYQSADIDLTVGKLAIQVRPGWWPFIVKVKSLAIEDVVITNKQPENQAQSDSGDTDIEAILASLQLPAPLHIEKALINRASLRRGNGSPDVLVDSIQLKASLGQQLKLDQLIIGAAGLSAELTGHLGLEAPFNLSAMLEGHFETDDKRSELELELPFKLKFQGQIEDWTFELDSSIQSGQSPPSRLMAQGAGTSRAVDIQSLSLEGEGVDLGFEGALDWSSEPEADVTARIRQLDLSPWVHDWPAGSFIEGSCEMNWSQAGLVIPVCALTVSETNLALDLDANVNVETNDVSARLYWSNLDWPLASTDTVFSSPTGELKLAGTIEKWSADGQLELRIGEFPKGSFELQAEGGRDQMHLLVPTGELLGGSVSAEANIDWADELSWKAVINTQSISTAPILPGWPGQLNAELEVQVDEPGNHTRVKISKLDGRLRGVPVYAHGSFAVEAGNMRFDQLEVRTDQAVLLLDGDALIPAGVSMTFNGELPAQLIQGVRGKVEAQGRYSGHADTPVLELNMQALGLGWNDYLVSELSISSHGSAAVPELQLDATDVSFSDLSLDEVSMSLKAVDGGHGLSMNVVMEDMVFSSQAVLTPSDTDQLFSAEWRADFKDMTLAIGQSHVLSLLKPAQLNWSADLSAFGPVCLTEAEGAEICLHGEYQAVGESWLTADVAAVPFNYLQDIFELDLKFEQFLEGRLEWHRAFGQAPTGGADFRMTAGKILDLENDELVVETSEGHFAFALQNGNLESGQLDLEFPGTGYIDIDFSILDVIDESARKLQGRAYTHLEDIQALAQVVLPGMDEVSGRFESTVQLSGTLTDPVFEGGFNLSNGLVNYAPVGLLLEEIEFEGQLNKFDRGSFKGGFRAGEGIGSINGQVLFNDFENIQLDVDFSGEQLLLTNTDQLKLRTETNINVSLSPERMDINGFITVPSARFSPSNLLVGGVNDSEDLIIEPIAGQLETVTADESSAYRVYGELELTFGDDVLIEVPDVETKLGGSVIFSWDGEPVPLAQGRFELNGTVGVYGPTLHISNGHISFPGVVADNPVLNIRAEREIYGNTQIRSAGVQVVGTLKRPILEAFTVPVTNEDRAWTILITGTDYDQGQGVNGFNVGTYIAPKLYISYGISLFEDENVASARYDLKKGFGIKVSSGQRETGLDVSYTIDK